MAARGTFSVTQPDKIDMTLTITMSVKEWKVVKAQLNPSASDGQWCLNDSINQILDKANTEFHFYEQVEAQ